MGLATTMEEMRQADLSIGKVINGVDNPNVLSVDSTAPFEDKVDSTTSEEVSTEKADDKKVDDKAKPAEKKVDEGKVAPKPGEKPAAKGKDTAEKRIGDLTKKYRTAERQAQHERTKRLEAEAELKKLREQVPATEKPKKEDFESDEEFFEALTDWKVEQKLKVNRDASVKAVKDKEEDEVIQEVEEEIAAMRERGEEAYDDFADVVYVKDLDVSDEMLEACLATDIPEHILYWLGKNPDKAAAIAKMSPLKAAKEIGKIEVEVAASIPAPNASQDEEHSEDEVKNSAAPKPKTTKTPDPINPVKPDGAVEKDPNKMSPKEYRAWREAQK